MKVDEFVEAQPDLDPKYPVSDMPELLRARGAELCLASFDSTAGIV